MTETTKKTTTRKKTTASASAPKAIAPKKTSKKVQEIRAASREEIAVLAHRFWAERGFQHGHDAEDWLPYGGVLAFDDGAYVVVTDTDTRASSQRVMSSST